MNTYSTIVKLIPSLSYFMYRKGVHIGVSEMGEGVFYGNCFCITCALCLRVWGV